MAMVPTSQMMPPPPPQQQQQPGAMPSGLLGNTGGMQNLAGNPFFNIGMALLSSRYDENINPFQAAVGGLQQSIDEQGTLDDRRRDEELREKLIEYFTQMQAGGMVPPASAGGMPGQAPGQFGQANDPMASLYRAGWDRGINPR